MAQLIDWALYTEKAVGRGSPSYADVVNRPLREVLTVSGADPDQAFVGFSLSTHTHDASAIVSGAVAPARGGTGVSSPTAGGLLVAAGIAAMTLLAPGASGQVVQSNGSAWVAQPLAIAAANITDLSTAATGITKVGTVGTGVWQGSPVAEAYLATLTTAGKVANSATTAASANTPNAIVARDASGNFSAGAITANVTGALTGNASTATTLATGRTISITGDLTYTSPSFDGSGNIAAVGTLAAVNANVGSFGSSTAIPVVTVTAKGLVVGMSTAAVIAPASTLTGDTLAGTVVASSLTSVGTIATGVWQGTAIANAYIAFGLDATKLTTGTTLPGNITASSLLSVGALTSLTVNGNLSAGAATFGGLLTLSPSGTAISITSGGPGTGSIILGSGAGYFQKNAANAGDIGLALGSAPATAGATTRQGAVIQLQSAYWNGTASANNTASLYALSRSAASGDIAVQLSNGHFESASDNGWDIGRPGSNRFRNLYLASTAVVGGNVVMGGALQSLTQSAAANLVFQTSVTADSANRFNINAQGDHWWGSGAGAQDTNLYRSGAGILRTDSALAATNFLIGTAGGLTRGGNYTTIEDDGGANVLWGGNATAAANLYDNTTHLFRSRGGATTFAQLSATAFIFGTDPGGPSILRIGGSALFAGGLDFGSVAAYPLINVSTSATVGANGGATALTANPAGYIVIMINGAGTYKIPYYNN